MKTAAVLVAFFLSAVCPLYAEGPLAPAPQPQPPKQISSERQQQLERLFQNLQKAYEDKDFQRMERLLRRDALSRISPERRGGWRAFGQGPRGLQNRFSMPQAGPRRWAGRNQFGRPGGRFLPEAGPSFRPMDVPNRWVYRGRPSAEFDNPRWGRPDAPAPARPRWAPEPDQWNRPWRFRRPMPAPDFRTD